MFKKFQDSLRTGRLVNAERTRIAAFLALGAYAIFLIFIVTLPNNMQSADGQFLVVDFLSFWLASFEALAGNPTLPFQTQSFLDLQVAATGQEKSFAFFYPPTWLMYVLPFGLFPFKTAFVLFNLTGFLVFFLAVYAIFGRAKYALMMCAVPAAMNCMLHGQNGLISAALLGAAFVALENRRLLLAGIFIGLLSFKPQLGILIPLALLFSANWKTFLSASVTTILVAGISWVLFGHETWLAFLDQIPVARLVLEEGIVDWGKMVSVYATMRLVGFPDQIAMLMQAAVAAVIVVLVFGAWVKSAPIYYRAAVLVSGGLLATPFALSYDLVILAIPIAFILKDAFKTGFLPYEKSLLLAVVVLSGGTSALAIYAFSPIAPLLPAAIVWMGWHRARANADPIG